jgi:hypothetical protein
MKLICNKLGNGNQHMFLASHQKNYFLFVRTYVTPTWNQKPELKNRHQKLLVFWKTYLKPAFTNWNMKINAH